MKQHQFSSLDNFRKAFSTLENNEFGDNISIFNRQKEQLYKLLQLPPTLDSMKVLYESIHTKEEFVAKTPDQVLYESLFRIY